MTCSMSMRNFVEAGWKLKKLKHVSALACIFVRRDNKFFKIWSLQVVGNGIFRVLFSTFVKLFQILSFWFLSYKYVYFMVCDSVGWQLFEQVNTAD
jgi:hypothetical protein